MDIVIKGDIDGIETAEEEINKNFDIPIIYLTAYADDEILKRAATTRPYGYILKPYKEKELKANIEMAIYRKKSEKENFDYEDFYRDVTHFIDENDYSFKKFILGQYSDEVEVSLDVALNKIYISANREEKTSDGVDIAEIFLIDRNNIYQ